MIDKCSDSHATIQDISEFVKREIRPRAAEIDRTGIFPKQIIEQMGMSRFLGAPFPLEYGGLNMNPLQYGHFTAEIGKACNACRTLLTVHSSLVGETLLKWGSSSQKKYWLPRLAGGEDIAAFALTEAQSGADAANLNTKYTVSGDKFVLNGKKIWISFGDIASLFMVACKGPKGVSVFLVRRTDQGVSTIPIEGILAGRGTHLAHMSFDNVIVDKERLLGPEGGGFAYVLNSALDFGRYSIAWAGVAVAEEAVEAIVGYIRYRQSFGSKLYSYQLIQGILADSITDLSAARALCVEAGESRCNMAEDAVMKTNIAKLFSSRAAVKITGDAVQVFGANGLNNLYPVERLFREAKVFEIIEGTTQIQQLLIAEYGLQKYFQQHHKYTESNNNRVND